ncbi:inositol-3-phosphate synthase, partial [archaeon]
MGEIRVAVAGVGNCCSALLQGLEYYRANGSKLGLLNPLVGGYGVGEISVVAAFDIDRNKIGRDLSEAIYNEPNKAPRFMDVGEQG